MALTVASAAVQRDEVRALVEEKERLLVGAAAAGADEEAGRMSLAADLGALRTQLAEAEALVTALKVGAPRCLCIRGEYIDNPSAPKPATPSPATTARAVPVLAVKKQQADAATTDSPRHQCKHRSRNTSMFERERKRVSARDKWLAERRQAQLDETLAEATFSPRVHSRRYKPGPPVRSAAAAKTVQERDSQSPSSSPAAQAAAARRYQAENGYWPCHEDLLVYMRSESEPELEPQAQLQAEPAVQCDDVRQTIEENEQLRETAGADNETAMQHASDLGEPGAQDETEMRSPVPPLRIPLRQYVTARTHQLAKGLAIQASHRSHPSYGRLSPAILPSSVDSARAVSPTTLALEANAAATSGRISVPCLNTPLASPVRLRPKTAGPISDSWPSPKGHSEQTKGDCSEQFPFTPQIAVHYLKGDRLARNLATKRASRSRLEYLASRHPTGSVTMPQGLF
eukprot:COSAG02_NODE_6483_length_3543_cov_9.326194_3_plen_458_part_00